MGVAMLVESEIWKGVDRLGGHVGLKEMRIVLVF